MAEGRRRDEWDRVAHLLAMLANCHRNQDKRPKAYHPDEFNPFTATRRRSGNVLMADDVEVAATLFVEAARNGTAN